MSGYLATINSSGENGFVYSLLAGVEGAWIGGIETATEGEFMCADGPEAGQVFWSNGPVLGRYTNWDSAEPNNNTIQGNEDRLQLLGPLGGAGGAAWNDLANGNTFYRINGYVVEYSPVPLPAAAWLLLSGLGGLGFLGRRCKAA